MPLCRTFVEWKITSKSMLPIERTGGRGRIYEGEATNVLRKMGGFASAFIRSSSLISAFSPYRLLPFRLPPFRRSTDSRARTAMRELSAGTGLVSHWVLCIHWLQSCENEVSLPSTSFVYSRSDDLTFTRYLSLSSPV